MVTEGSQGTGRVARSPHGNQKRLGASTEVSETEECTGILMTTAIATEDRLV